MMAEAGDATSALVAYGSSDPESDGSSKEDDDVGNANERSAKRRRTRIVPHIEGQYAVFISLEISDPAQVLTTLARRLAQCSPCFVPLSEYHISLSKTVYVMHGDLPKLDTSIREIFLPHLAHVCDQLLKSAGATSSQGLRIPLDLLSWEVLPSVSTREQFFSVRVVSDRSEAAEVSQSSGEGASTQDEGPRNSPSPATSRRPSTVVGETANEAAVLNTFLRECVRVSDGLMKRHGKDVFFDPPKFHVSVAWESTLPSRVPSHESTEGSSTEEPEECNSYQAGNAPVPPMKLLDIHEDGRGTADIYAQKILVRVGKREYPFSLRGYRLPS